MNYQQLVGRHHVVLCKQVVSLLLLFFVLCASTLSVMAQDEERVRETRSLRFALMQTEDRTATEPRSFHVRAGDRAPSPIHRGLVTDNQQWEQTRRALRTTTLVGLWATGGLGTIIALNRPTLLSDGLCQTGNPIFGSYGCGELSTVHGITAITSVVSYTASEILELTVGPGEQQSRTLTWVHRAGIAVLPLAGIFSRFPEVIGITGSDAQEDFSRTLRSIHAGVGYTTVIAYTLTF